jgi:hypothetical protein
MIWTLHNHKEGFGCRLPIRTSPSMESPQCIPCITTDPLLGNRITRTKLPQTTSWHPRRRSGIRSRTNHWVKMSRKKENALVQGAMEGVFTSTRLVGTSVSSAHPGPDRRVSKNQTFWKEQCHHQLRIGLRNHDKTLPATAMSALLIPNQSKMSSVEHQLRKRWQTRYILKR